MALTSATAGRSAEAEAGLKLMRDSVGSVASPEVALFDELVQVLNTIADGDEADARDRFEALLELLPLDTPQIAQLLRNLLGIVYVLSETARVHFDEDDLGPSWDVIRTAARALVAARSGRVDILKQLEWPDPAITFAGLGIAFATELAARGHDAGCREAVGLARWLVDEIGDPARTWLRRLAGAELPAVASGARALLADVPMPPREHVRLELLGPVVLLREGAIVEDRDWARQRVRELVAYMEANESIAAGTIGDVLWPDLPPERADHNLRVNLAYLRRVLEPERGRREATWYVRRDGPTVHLGPLETDVGEFEQLVQDAELAPSPKQELELLEGALDLWRGEYLADLAGQSWATIRREHLRKLQLRALVRSGELELGRGDADRAAERGRAAIAVDEYDEAAHRLVIAAALASSDTVAARRAVEQCQAMLADLAVEPAEETAMLFRLVSSPTG